MCVTTWAKLHAQFCFRSLHTTFRKREQVGMGVCVGETAWDGIRPGRGKGRPATGAGSEG